MQLELAPMRSDLTVLKLMMGLLLASTISLVLKAFFLKSRSSGREILTNLGLGVCCCSQRLIQYGPKT
jgi:hypothetical protein